MPTTSGNGTCTHETQDGWTPITRKSQSRSSQGQGQGSPSAAKDRTRLCRYKAYVFLCLLVKSLVGEVDPHFILVETPFDYQKFGFPGGSFEMTSSQFHLLKEYAQRLVVVKEAGKEIAEEVPGLLSVLKYNIDPNKVGWIGPHSTKVTNRRGTIEYVAAYLFIDLTPNVLAHLNIGSQLKHIPEASLHQVRTTLIDPVNARLTKEGADREEGSSSQEVLKVHLVPSRRMHYMAESGNLWKTHADVVEGVAPTYPDPPPGMRGRSYADVMQQFLSCASHPKP